MTVEIPDRDALTRSLEALGLPAPDRIAPVGRQWRHAMWRVGFPEQSKLADVLVRRPILGGVRTLNAELAALTALQGTDLPVVRRYKLIDAGPGPAALSELLPGMPGDEVMAKFPQFGPAVARSVGDVMRRLARVRQPSHGLAAIGNKFVPTRATWPEAWRARIWRLRTEAAAGGARLGQITRRLDEEIQARLSSLAAVMDFSLVHGDLQPGNLLFRPEGDGVALCGVIDWESACAADPLVDWALPLLVDDATLGHVVAGYGVDALDEALAEPAAIERIELYHLTHLMERLAFAVGPTFRDAPARRAGALAQAVHLMRAFFDGPGAERRLRRAARDGGGAVAGLSRPRSADVLRVGLVDALARGAIVDPAAAWTWTGAAGCAALADRAPSAGDAWVEMGLALLVRLEVGDGPVFGDLISDRQEWTGALVARTLRSSASSGVGPGTDIALLAAALELDAALGGGVSDDAFRALEVAIHGLIGLGAGWREGIRISPTIALAHGVMGLAALRVLEPWAPADEPSLNAVRGAYATQTGGAWRQLGIEPTPGDLQAVLDQGPPSVRAGDEPALTPAICAALAGLDAAGAIPVPASAIADALGLRGATGADPD